MCCGTACSRVTQEHAGSDDCLSEMNADLLPLDKVVTGHGGTGKWTRKKAFGFSRRVRSRPRCGGGFPHPARGKGNGRNSDRYGYIGKGHARMQVRRDAPPCASASELLKTLTTHDAWEVVGEQIYEELRAVSKGDVDKSLYYSPATGWLLEDMCSDLAVYRREAAATRIQACWRGAAGRAKATFLRASLSAVRLALQAAQEMGWTVHGYRSEVVGREHRLVVFAEPLVSPAEWAATRIQACWRGWLGRDDYQAAKQAKAKKERRAKRAEAKREAKAMQVSFSERLETASPPDKSAGQLVVGKTILGHSIANDEPLHGGKCTCVGLLTGDVPPCLGGSVTVFDDAPEAFYYAAWDYCERYIDQACDVRFFDLTGSEGIFTDITSLRQLLSVGDPFDLPGNPDLQTFLAERREPLGYTNTGRRLIHSQDLVFMVVAAVFMQIDVVLLDAASACPLYMIVRCRLDPRRACAPSH